MSRTMALKLKRDTEVAVPPPVDSLNDDKFQVTKVVTYVLLGLFGASVIALFIISVWLLPYCEATPAKCAVYEGWFELLKSALVLVGTALTTIIGYYFGQREAESAREKATEAIAAVEVADSDKEEMRRFYEELLATKPTVAATDQFDPNAVPRKTKPSGT